jgi:hypothetical protein
MDEALEKLVRERAGHCREYYRLPEKCSSLSFEIDHIIARQHGGETTASNLALAGFADNHHKGPNLGSIDPKTGKKVWLFHPRRHKWDRHFPWDGPMLVGRTPIGRATIEVLAINLPYRVAQRAALIEEGVFPPAWARFIPRNRMARGTIWRPVGFPPGRRVHPALGGTPGADDCSRWTSW